MVLVAVAQNALNGLTPPFTATREETAGHGAVPGAELTNLLHLLPRRRRVELQLIQRNCLAGASVPEGKTQPCVRPELRSEESELL